MLSPDTKEFIKEMIKRCESFIKDNEVNSADGRYAFRECMQEDVAEELFHAESLEGVEEEIENRYGDVVQFVDKMIDYTLERRT